MVEAVGQLNMYLNYYAVEVNDEYDNAPIGIILCTDKDSVSAEYALGGMANNIFAFRYVSYIPKKEQLIAQVETVLKDWHEKENQKNSLGLFLFPCVWQGHNLTFHFLWVAPLLQLEEKMKTWWCWTG